MTQTSKTSLLTIAIPFEEDRKFGPLRADIVEDMLDDFGNPVGAKTRAEGREASPASAALHTAIEAMERVHFMSLNVIRGQDIEEPTFLVLEASADGGEQDIIKDFVTHCGELLLPIFREACGARSTGDMHKLLKRHRLDLQSVIPHIPWRQRKVVGLGFKGSQDLSLKQIQADRDLFEIATESIAKVERRNSAADKPPLAAGSLLGAARIQLRGWANDPLDLIDDPANPDDTKLVSERVRALLQNPDRMEDLLERLDNGPELNWTDTDNAPWSEESTPMSGSIMSILRNVGLFTQTLAILLLLLLAAGLIGFGIRPSLILFVLGGLLLIVAVGLVLLMRSESGNRPKDIDPDPRIMREIMMRENRTPAHNHMISVTHILPEAYRKRVTLPLAFRAVQQSAIKGHFRRGFLADIGTIHFARWFVLPGTNRMVFFSNYNANWESYLEDFITKATAGLTGIWSNCVGFPKTALLFGAGAEDGDRFKRWARKSMIPTRLWYTAYGDLTLSQIRRNALVREGLRKIDTTSDAEACLALFSSVPRPEASLETEDIQSLFFGGNGNLKDSACLAIQFPDDTSEKQRAAWLANLRPRITLGNGRSTDQAIYVAFSASGLARLGMHEEVRTKDDPYPAPPKAFDADNTEFPAVFSFGMDDPTRQRVLNDSGDNDPAKWAWGPLQNSETRADAVLLLYAKGPEDEDGPTTHIDILVDQERRAAQASGLKVLKTIRMKRLPYEGKFTEPFGFVDGVSQPLVRGQRIPQTPADKLNLIEPGEILLGYKDNRGFFPPSPTVDHERDPNGTLPVPPEAMPTRYPTFTTKLEGGEPRRDFGRNGSYLVIRQLEQNVDGFDTYTERVAEQLNAGEKSAGRAASITAEFVGAKMVGRWKNGTSLARNPKLPGYKAPDNDFIYSRDDPQGHGCPFGAHVRRANPRDSLNPDNQHALSIANRHRILRRGRSYIGTDHMSGSETEGTFFMCLNADLERQYEFIQQNWCASPSFHGLSDEVDPIAAQHCGHSRFTIPGVNGPKRIDGWESFVRMRGGGYFFLPGGRALNFLAAPRV